MTTAKCDTHPRSQQLEDDSITASLHLLETMLDEGQECMFDMEYLEALGTELRRLHARIRIHHAVACYDRPENCVTASPPATGPVPPEFVNEMNRLCAEHPMILGHLDRLIRSVDSMADRPLEDKDVFVMRVRELIAVLRRHEAEEDRLFYLTMWSDTGGES